MGMFSSVSETGGMSFNLDMLCLCADCADYRAAAILGNFIKDRKEGRGTLFMMEKQRKYVAEYVSNQVRGKEVQICCRVRYVSNRRQPKGVK